MLELLCVALAAHLSQNLFLTVKICGVDSLLELRIGEELAEVKKPTTWHLLFFFLFWAMLSINLCGKAIFLLIHHGFLLVIVYLVPMSFNAKFKQQSI